MSMTMEEKDRMLNKYKYGIDYSGRIMNDEEANMIKKQKTINKKVLGEVLNREIIWCEIKNTTLIYTFGNGLAVSEKSTMSIYELQHLYKIWAESSESLRLKSWVDRRHSPVRQVGVCVINNNEKVITNEMGEPYAVFDCCEWIFNEKTK